MTKRILSGLFLLVALGALGLILAGALTSGEQLIVRFLTAIIVAALCLYVISDLRLRAGDSTARSSAKRSPANSHRRRASTAPGSLPPNSTAAFMATVTGKRSATGAPRTAEPAPAAGSRSPTAQSEIVPTVPPATTPPPASSSSAYDDDVDAEAWPSLPDEPAELDEEPADSPVSIFTRRGNDPEVEYETEPQALAANDHYRPPMPTVSTPNLTPITGGALATAKEDPSIGGGSEGGDSNGDNSAEGSVVDQDASVAFNGGDVGAEAEVDELFLCLADPHANPEPVAQPSLHHGTDLYVADDEIAVDEAPVDVTPLDESARGGSADDHTGDGEIVDLEQAEPTIAKPTVPDPLASQPMPGTQAMPGLEAAARARAAVIELLAGEGGVRDLDAAIESGELQIIRSLMKDGTLSVEGPISDRDVRTMVFVAFTSNELRKILLAGGRLDGEFDEFGLELGPVDVFCADDPTSDIPQRRAIAFDVDPESAVVAAGRPPTSSGVESSAHVNGASSVAEQQPATAG